jgi:hypothetical protein
MASSQTEYRSYLLRLWRLGKNEPWHVMLEQVGSKEKHTFVDLESLIDFLQPSEDESAVETNALLFLEDDTSITE